MHITNPADLIIARYCLALLSAKNLKIMPQQYTQYSWYRNVQCKQTNEQSESPDTEGSPMCSTINGRSRAQRKANTNADGAHFCFHSRPATQDASPRPVPKTVCSLLADQHIWSKPKRDGAATPRSRACECKRIALSVGLPPSTAVSVPIASTT